MFSFSQIHLQEHLDQLGVLSGTPFPLLEQLRNLPKQDQWDGRINSWIIQDKEMAFLNAASSNLPLLEHMVKHPEISQDVRDQALIIAASSNNPQAVSCLLQHGANPKIESSCALRMGVLANSLECVKLLRDVSTPVAKRSLALRTAVMKDHWEIAQILTPVSRTPLVVMDLAWNDSSRYGTPTPNPSWLAKADRLACLCEEDMLKACVKKIRDSGAILQKAQEMAEAYALRVQLLSELVEKPASARSRF